MIPAQVQLHMTPAVTSHLKGSQMLATCAFTVIPRAVGTSLLLQKDVRQCSDLYTLKCKIAYLGGSCWDA